jgi:hypothetical protein
MIDGLPPGTPGASDYIPPGMPGSMFPPAPGMPGSPTFGHTTESLDDPRRPRPRRAPLPVRLVVIAAVLLVFLAALAWIIFGVFNVIGAR